VCVTGQCLQGSSSTAESSWKLGTELFNFTKISHIYIKTEGSDF
jgi:hypothetical protein